MLKSRKAMWLILLILVFIVPVLFSHKAEAANLN